MINDFLADKDFKVKDYECLAILIYNDEERVAEYYFI
mgnify:CR=1 FL=1